MSSPRTVVVISKDQVLSSIVNKFLKECCQVIEFAALRSALDYIYSSIPDVLLIDMTSGDPPQ